MSKICSREDCERKVAAWGMCRRHYQYFYRKGETPKDFRWEIEGGTRMKCSQLDCDRPVKCRGLCNRCYQRARADLKPKKDFRQTKWVNPDGTRKTCTVEGCDTPVKTSGLCSPHYHARWKIGTNREPLPPKLCPTPGCGRKMVNRNVVCAKCNRDRWRYGLDPERWIDMNRPENRVCSNASCQSTDVLHVDHDHFCECQGSFKAKDRVSCGKCVRGWLCRSCNLGLGYFKDDPHLLQGITDYIRNWKTPSA